MASNRERLAKAKAGASAAIASLKPAEVEAACALLVGALRAGGKVLTCGNGGSAADADHFAAELVVRYARDRPALPAVSLCGGAAVLTAAANDLGYERVFERGVEALGRPGDVLVCISTSGRSGSVNRAAGKAKEMGLKVVYLCGREKPAGAVPDVAVTVDAQETPRVQEAHRVALHVLAEAAE